MGKIIRREGADLKVMEIFYRAVTQAVFLFSLETWVLLVAMERMVEAMHVGFTRQITGKQAWQKADGTWVNPNAEVVREAAGTQSEMTYTRRR